MQAVPRAADSVDSVSLDELLLAGEPLSDEASDKDDTANEELLLESILAEDGDDVTEFLGDRNGLSAERRAELDLLLQQADALARPSSRSRAGSLNCLNVGCPTEMAAASVEIEQLDHLRSLSQRPSAALAPGDAARAALVEPATPATPATPTTPATMTTSLMSTFTTFSTMAKLAQGQPRPARGPVVLPRGEPLEK